MERYGLGEEMSLRQLNHLNEIVHGHMFIERFRLCGVRSRILEVHLTDVGENLDDPDAVIKDFLHAAIGLVPEHRYERRLAAA